MDQSSLGVIGFQFKLVLRVTILVIFLDSMDIHRTLFSRPMAFALLVILAATAGYESSTRGESSVQRRRWTDWYIFAGKMGSWN